MSEPSQTKDSHETRPDAAKAPLIHRVCITCNNMFVVTPDNYESKQCPSCHKG